MPPPNRPAHAQQLRFVAVAADDPRAQPLLDELADEYAQRYESTTPTVMAWLKSVPTAEFAPPEATGYARLPEPLPARGPVFPIAFVKVLA